MTNYPRQENSTWPRSALLIMWASGVLMGASAMNLLINHEKPSTNTTFPPLKDPISVRLDRIETAITQASITRCMNVTTPALTVSVYNTENLGIKPLPKPAYDKPIPKGVFDVPQVPGEDAGPEVRSEP